MSFRKSSSSSEGSNENVKKANMKMSSLKRSQSEIVKSESSTKKIKANG